MEEEGGLESRPLHEAEGPLTPVCDHDANTPGATCCLGQGFTSVVSLASPTYPGREVLSFQHFPGKKTKGQRGSGFLKVMHY